MTASTPAGDGLDLDGLRYAAGAATPGPWFDVDDDLIGGRCVMTTDREPSAGDPAVTAYVRPDDSHYIAAVNPTVLLALIARVEAAEAAASAARDLANRSFAMAREHDSEECESGCRDEMAEIRMALAALDGVS